MPPRLAPLPNQSKRSNTKSNTTTNLTVVTRPPAPESPFMRLEREEDDEDRVMDSNPHDFPFPTFNRTRPVKDTTTVEDLVELVKEDNEHALLSPRKHKRRLQEYIVHKEFVLPSVLRKRAEAEKEAYIQNQRLQKQPWKIQSPRLTTHETYIAPTLRSTLSPDRICSKFFLAPIALKSTGDGSAVEKKNPLLYRAVMGVDEQTVHNPYWLGPNSIKKVSGCPQLGIPRKV
eukprot:PhF_6_TR40984/c0_g1_i2/m.62075